MSEHTAECDAPFQSRYGQDEYDDGKPRGCPDEMYPWDVDYPGEVVATFAKFRERCSHDSLNLPISWYFCDEAEYGFELVWVMPRKYGKTWSLRLAPGFDRAEVEAWLEDWTREVAAKHYGWTTPIPPAEKRGACGATRDEPEKCRYPGGCPIPPEGGKP